MICDMECQRSNRFLKLIPRAETDPSSRPRPSLSPASSSTPRHRVKQPIVVRLRSTGIVDVSTATKLGVAMRDDGSTITTTTSTELYEKPKVLEESRDTAAVIMSPGSVDDDDDLTLLDNLEWLINFPVGSLLPYALDDEEEGGQNRRDHRPVNRQRHHRSMERRNPVQSRSDGKSARKPGVRTVSNNGKCGSVQKRHTDLGIVNRQGTNKKPPMTYPQLIEKCLRENGGLTVHGIYRWLHEKYPFFRNKDGKWKNAIRHNLSIRSQFRKGEARGRSHVWYLDDHHRHILQEQQQLEESPSMKLRTPKVENRDEDDGVTWLPQGDLIDWSHVEPPVQIFYTDTSTTATHDASSTPEQSFMATSFAGALASQHHPGQRQTTPIEVISEVEINTLDISSDVKGYQTPSFFHENDADGIRVEEYDPPIFRFSGYMDGPQFIDQVALIRDGHHRHQEQPSSSNQLLPLLGCSAYKMPHPAEVSCSDELFLADLDTFGLGSSALL